MNYKKTVLKNGMRIITVPMSNNPTVTVMVLVEAGSKYETKDINGISHFLEHLCFKGTKKRPTAFDITKELDGLGAQSSAFTMEEVTGYYAKAHKKHLPKLLDVISDIYANSVFDPKEIEKEKGVIIDELNMYEDAPMMHVRDIFMYALYGDQPAGWNIGGSKKNVKNMTRGDIISYREKLYVAEATTVVVSGGGFETKKLVKDIEKKFANIVDKKKATKKKVKSTQKKPNIFLEQKKTDQTHMVLGVKTYDIHSTNNPALSVLSGVLGKGMSSRLFQKIRDEMGVGYYVRVDNQALTDHGFFSVHTGVSNDRVKEVISVILKECKRLTVEEVSEKELKKVKDFLTGNFALSLESS
ncbi:MAG: insulinase family protein, partial [Candidatus Pacebacteria bacterium]|nr:insulinase family protein [Candidatus Paceibacterota bacterium]